MRVYIIHEDDEIVALCATEARAEKWFDDLYVLVDPVTEGRLVHSPYADEHRGRAWLWVAHPDGWRGRLLGEPRQEEVEAVVAGITKADHRRGLKVDGYDVLL